MRKKGVLYLLSLLLILSLTFFQLIYVVGSLDFPFICCLIIPLGFLILILYVFLKKGRKRSTSRSESDERDDEEKLSAEKYSAEQPSTKKEKGIFSTIFGEEDRCDECGAEMVYKDGADAYYCPECEEYKWK